MDVKDNQENEIKNIMPDKSFKYSLDTSSKKFECPSCGKKRFVRYIDIETKQYLDEKFGRCDRENDCQYFLQPDGTTNTFVEIEKKIIEVAYPNGNTYKQFEKTDSNFHQFCYSLGVTEEFLREMVVGKSNDYTCFGIMDTEQKILNTKFIKYNQDGHRDKEKYPFYMKPPEGKKFLRCLYGLHLFDPTIDCIIVESEKTAVLGKFFYPSLNWLATGGSQGAKAEHIEPLYGYKKRIIYLSDNDKAGSDNKSIKNLLKLNEVSKNVSIINPFINETDGFDVADWIVKNKESITGDLLKDLGIEIEELEIEKQDLDISQEITFGFNPVEAPVLVWLNGVRFCSVGNIATIVAGAGSGKSQTCEAIAASFINPDCDALGFSCDLPDDRPFMLVDGERTHEDCKTGFIRISTRADIASNPEIRDGDRLKRFRFESFIGIGDTDKRKEELERLIEEINPALILLDDITMICKDINDNKEADSVLRWLVALANRVGFGVICTIHPNPKDKEDFKPRGHIGTRVWHKSESVYALIKAIDDPETRRLTTDFGMGKARSATDVNEVNYKWNNDLSMFTSCDYQMKVSGVERIVDYSQRFADIWTGQESTGRLKSSTILSIYMDAYEVSTRTARNHIKDAVDLGIIEKHKKEGRSQYYSFLNRNDTPF